eukprot:GILI01028637.1.p1 GENE.GILI01028637.1~~GILI01028637.1.p1  ORF type:complete len:288 (+),score=17.73 GILI01028637.1:120-983(+)
MSDVAKQRYLLHAMVINALPPHEDGNDDSLVMSTIAKIWKPSVIAGHLMTGVCKVRGQLLQKICTSKRPREGEVGDADGSALNDIVVDFLTKFAHANANVLAHKTLFEIRHLAFTSYHVCCLLDGPFAASDNLVTIDLECNALSDEVILAIDEHIRGGRFRHVSNLYLASNAISGSALDALAVNHKPATVNSLLTQVKDFGLTNNPIGTQPLVDFISFLSVTSELPMTRLHLNHVANLDALDYQICVNGLNAFLSHSTISRDTVWFKQNLIKGAEVKSITPHSKLCL